MNPKPEEDSQATSLLLRVSFLLVTLAACQQIDKGSLAFTSKPPTATVVKENATKPPAKKKKKKIYLTFDDGPNRGTGKVLNIMQQEAVPVSFFIVGEHVFASMGQQQIWDSLKMATQIDLCNHSYTHAWHNRFNTYYQHPDSVVSDFTRCHDSLVLNNTIGRTPGRNAWRIDTLQYTDLSKSKAAVDSLQNAGYIIMGWDLEWHYDGKTLVVKNNAAALLQQIDSVFANNKTKLPDHLVLLAHDQVYADATDSAELHNFIKLLKNSDYELELVTHYPAIKNKLYADTARR